jgi:hypothetical protein
MLTPKEWQTQFLSVRNLAGPDSRALYAYKTAQEEFEALQSTLRNLNPRIDKSGPASAAFALYAAEWWRRNYQGGPWKWEPLLDSIGWNIPFSELYPRLISAWRWWGIKPVILSSHIRYLGTCACQGGIPLQLIANGPGAITRFLKALLKEYKTFRRVVEDGYQLAEPLRAYLPRTLRQEPVFRICSDLVDQIWDLRAGIAGSQDPIKLLDDRDPQWRDKMPIDLQDDTARDLIEALLVEAAKPELSPAMDFRVVRFLERGVEAPRLSVEFQVPPTMSTAHFKRLVGSAIDLPRRFELRAGNEVPRAIAVGRVAGEDVVFTKREVPPEWLASVAAGDLSFSVVAGGSIGSRFTPRGGEALTDLPWAFIDRDGDGERFDFYGEGSAGTRLPSLVVACPVEDSEALSRSTATERWSSDLLSRAVFTVSGEASITTSAGLCRFRSSAPREITFTHELGGIRCYQLQSRIPLFFEPPILYTAVEDGPRTRVPNHEISWKSRGDWRTSPTWAGIWTIRRQLDVETVFAAKVCITGKHFSARIVPGNHQNKGKLELLGVPLVTVGCTDEAVDVSLTSSADITIAAFSARAEPPPAVLNLALKLPGSESLAVSVPFPGRGGRFLNGTAPDADLTHTLAIGALYGWRAVVVSPVPTERFRMCGELIACDLTTPIRRAAHFTAEVPQTSEFVSELPLIDVHDRLLTLFAATKDIDAEVRLTIFGSGPDPIAITKVRRFSADVEHEQGLYWVKEHDANGGSLAQLQALNLCNPSQGHVSLQAQMTEGVTRGWTLTQEHQNGHAWLVVANRDGEFFARPKILGSASPCAEPVCHLSEAAEIADDAERTKAMERILNVMVKGEGDEQDWTYLSDLIRESEGLPATTFTALDCLIANPTALVRLLFRSEAALRERIWNLESELPFTWILIPFKIWLEETSRYALKVRHEMTTMGIADSGTAADQAQSHLLAVVREGIQRSPALTILEDIALLGTAGMPSTKLLKIASNSQAQEAFFKKLSDQRQEVLRADREWPVGADRGDWKQMVPLAAREPWCDFWLDTERTGYQRPLLDAPFGAAYAACDGARLRPLLVHSTKLLRAYDPAWFDTAYFVVALIVLGQERSLII